jgi:GntR family transcriptional regulator
VENRAERIADDLRDAIRSRRYPPGAKMLSTRQLMDRYGTSKATVQRAVDLLKAEGLIVGEKGRGVFVRPAPPVILTSTAASYWSRRATGEANWNAEVRAQGRTPRQEIISSELVPAPPEIARRLNLDEDAQVLLRRRIMLADEQPMQLCDGYYPAALVQGTKLVQPRPIRGGAHAELELIAGPWLRFIEDVQVRMPTPDEARQLKIVSGVPVVRTLRTLYNTEDRPVEVLDELRPADRYRFRYAIDLGPPA